MYNCLFWFRERDSEENEDDPSYRPSDESDEDNRRGRGEQEMEESDSSSSSGSDSDRPAEVVTECDSEEDQPIEGGVGPSGDGAMRRDDHQRDAVCSGEWPGLKEPFVG